VRRIHQRIAGVNPAINAVVASRPRAARAEADAADARLRAERPSRLPPLHGVPCTIKEAFALTGMAHTSGLVARRAEDLPLVLSALSEQPEVDTSIDAQAHAAEVLPVAGRV
jgi:Asp-tRNA(Asn)/Glu-tRNA(Gln) amidotransferase A subunit family amidase